MKYNWGIDFEYPWYEGGEDTTYEEYADMTPVKSAIPKICDFIKNTIVTIVSDFNSVLADDLDAYIWNIEVNGNSIVYYGPNNEWLETKPGMAEEVYAALKVDYNNLEDVIKEYLEDTGLMEDEED